MRAVALQHQHYVARVAALLACICALACFLYGVFLLEAVAHTAALSSATAQVRAVSAQLGGVENQYLSATQSLTPQRAQELGFITPAAADVTTVFATAQPNPLSFGGK